MYQEIKTEGFLSTILYQMTTKGVDNHSGRVSVATSWFDSCGTWVVSCLGLGLGSGGGGPGGVMIITSAQMAA